MRTMRRSTRDISQMVMPSEVERTVSRAGTRVRCVAALCLCVTASVTNAQDISIVAPEAEEVVHNNLGDVDVVVSVNGAPPSANVQILVDGKPAGAPQQADTFALHGIERGAHTVQAKLLAGNGKMVAISAPLTFYMWQASIYIPNQQPPPPLKPTQR